MKKFIVTTISTALACLTALPAVALTPEEKLYIKVVRELVSDRETISYSTDDDLLHIGYYECNNPHTDNNKNETRLARIDRKIKESDRVKEIMPMMSRQEKEVFSLDYKIKTLAAFAILCAVVKPR